MRTLSLALVLLLLVACGSGHTRSAAELEKDYAFDVVTDRAAIPAGPDGRVALDLFLARNGARYGDRLVVDADAETRADLRRRYAIAGIRVLAAPGVVPHPSGAFQAVFSRLIVTPPACGDWSEGTGEDFDNQPHPNFGCAQKANLARMVADPHDLIAGRDPEGPYDSRADAYAVRAYRTHGVEWGEADASTTDD